MLSSILNIKEAQIYKSGITNIIQSPFLVLLSDVHILQISVDADLSGTMIEAFSDTKEWNLYDIHQGSIVYKPLTIHHEDIIDFAYEGDRWEGDTVNGVIIGWGSIYNSENQLCYTGFYAENMPVCYGTQFHADLGTVRYNGNFCNGKYCGNGSLMDRHGNLLFEGKWFHGNEMIQKICLPGYSADENLLNTTVEEIQIGRKCFNNLTKLDLNSYFNLRKFIIGDDCFRYVDSFFIDGLNNLESIHIGKNCFTRNMHFWIRDEFPHSFHLRNCAQLKELQIENGSFNNYSGVFEIRSRIGW